MEQISEHIADSSKRLRYLLIVLCIVLGSITLLPKIQEAQAENNGIIEFENKTDFGTGFLGAFRFMLKLVRYCLLPYSFDSLSNICIPYVIGPNSSQINASCDKAGISLGDELLRGYISYIVAVMILIPVLIAVLILLEILPSFLASIVLDIAAPILSNVNACMNAYVLLPNEMLSIDPGKNNTTAFSGINSVITLSGQAGPNALCVNTSGALELNTPALQPIDVPFFYGCSSQCRIWNFTIDQMSQLPPNITKLDCTDDYPNVTKPGFLKDNTLQCCTPQAQSYARPDFIRTITVCMANFVDRIKGNRERCSVKKDTCITLGEPGTTTRSQKTKLGDMTISAFYKIDGAHIQYCAAALGPVLLPIVIGCTSVAGPYEEPEVTEFHDFLTKNNADETTMRCKYILPEGGGRTDLQQVALEIERQSGGFSSVSLFLKSDLHLTSTIVGCINDLLLKVFITTPPQGQSFFGAVQDNLKGIVFVVLVLYVALIGLKILTSSEAPHRGEMIMYVIKFALVLYFATGNAWYDNNAALYKNGKGPGIYSAILDTIQTIPDFFMQARENSDPIGYCYYPTPGVSPPVNLLSQQIFDTSNGEVQLTVWDYLDCTIVTYLSLGSCKYSLEGMVFIWFVTIAFWLGATGILLSIMSFIYATMILFVLFKFVHLTLLCMFAVTILVLIAPLILCFALFEHTKAIFDSWLRTIIGYILYPGLLFAFLALMLTIFDSIFYGNIDTSVIQGYKEKCITSKNCTISNAEFNQLCSGVNSLYCAIMQQVQNAQGEIDIQNCSIRAGQITAALTEKINIPLLGTVTTARSAPASFLLPIVAKMLLFTVLFYFFMDSIAEFLGTLIGVYGLASGAKGSLNLAAITAAMARTTISLGRRISGK